jgi:hypothetical protein
MTAPPDHHLKTAHHGRWKHVYADCDGEDVSHLGYAPYHVQIGADATVRMAGIGGVGTESEHRRRGLAREVFAHAMKLMRAEGFSTVGLYTSRRIVAHRLYRRFGLVDVVRRRHYLKLLDPGRLAQQVVRELVLQSKELQARRLTLCLRLGGRDPILLRIEANEVSALEAAPGRADLTLTMSDETLARLASHGIGLAYASEAKLVRWSGDVTAYEAVARAIESQREPIHEG